MSTSNPLSLPTQRPRPFWRSWRFLLLALVLLGGGAYWWARRLTPEEQFLVGRWSVTAQLPNGSVSGHTWEFLSNRRFTSNGAWWNWTASGDRFTVQEHAPSYRVVWNLVNSGFKSRSSERPAAGQLEIINSQEAKITLINPSTGQDGSRLHLRRVPPD